ncbi:MAG TPA: ribosome-binding factor A [Acidimicrobiales bacterium]|jgi:ribosome-binding factor A|nr:ribosome-binding factor A [Acidimicrobiales bacterium]
MAKTGRPKRAAADRRLPSTSTRQYPRLARVNEVLREVLAEAIERLADSDDRLALLTVTAVSSDPDLAQATVLFASLSDDAQTALGEHRLRLQEVIAGQVRLRRTPKLAFAVDPAVTTGDRIEEILRHLHTGDQQGDAG